MSAAAKEMISTVASSYLIFSIFTNMLLLEAITACFLSFICGFDPFR